MRDEGTDIREGKMQETAAGMTKIGRRSQSYMRPMPEDSAVAVTPVEDGAALDASAVFTAPAPVAEPTFETPETLAQALVDRLDANPALRVPAQVILTACAEEPQEEGALIAAATEILTAQSAMPVQRISSVIEMLVRYNALEETLRVNGEIYDGTLEDAFNDESIAEDAETLIFANITEAGIIALVQINPKRRASELFASQPHHVDGFLATLAACNTPEGLSTKALQDVLDEQGLLYRSERTNIPTIYPSMYTNFLKDVGCMSWNHAWITTDLGREVLTESGR